MANQEMSEEDFLKQHIKQQESVKNPTPTSNIEIIQKDSSRSSDLQYFNFDVKELPCGQFYPAGTLFMVRPANVKEIQSYSMVDDNNFYDIVEKMNDMLSACVRVKYPDGRVSSYLDVKDQDRLYLIFTIRELTFQQGNELAVTVKCDACGESNQVELIRKHFKFHEFDEKLMKYFDRSSNSFIFRTVNNKQFELIPPNIGIQKAFTEYIVKENNENRQPNLSFLKIIPFMLGGRNSITMDGIKSKLTEFEQMDDISFQFLNAAVGKMTFGIKDLVKPCSACGVEVRTEMQFPNGASGIFVIHDAFEAFIKE
jgi:hypothetical protein